MKNESVCSPMQDTPPVAYPRKPFGFGSSGCQPAFSGYGTAEKLLALADAYHGSWKVFSLNAALIVLMHGPIRTYPQSVMIAVCLSGFFAVTAYSYYFNRRIAFGKGMDLRFALIWSLPMAVTTALCSFYSVSDLCLLIAMIGAIAMPLMVHNEIKKYGLNDGSLICPRTFRNAVVALKMSEMQAEFPPP